MQAAPAARAHTAAAPAPGFPERAAAASRMAAEGWAPSPAGSLRRHGTHARVWPQCAPALGHLRLHLHACMQTHARARTRAHTIAHAHAHAPPESDSPSLTNLRSASARLAPPHIQAAMLCCAAALRASLRLANSTRGSHTCASAGQAAAAAGCDACRSGSSVLKGCCCCTGARAARARSAQASMHTRSHTHCSARTSDSCQFTSQRPAGVPRPRTSPALVCRQRRNGDDTTRSTRCCATAPATAFACAVRATRVAVQRGCQVQQGGALLTVHAQRCRARAGGGDTGALLRVGMLQLACVRHRRVTCVASASAAQQPCCPCAQPAHLQLALDRQRRVPGPRRSRVPERILLVLPGVCVATRLQAGRRGQESMLGWRTAACCSEGLPVARAAVCAKHACACCALPTLLLLLPADLWP